MSLKLNREDVSWSRIKRALPLFFLLWSGGALLATLLLFTVRGSLQEIEREATGKMLNDYLATGNAVDLHLGFIPMGSREPLRGLAFIRMVRGSDHVILVNEHGEHLDIKALVDLSPTEEGVWLRIGSGVEQRVLTIVTGKYGDNVIVQAGADSRANFRVYKMLEKRIIVIVLLSSLLLLPLALFYVRLSLTPLVSTEKSISELILRPKSTLLPEQGNGPELDRLYKQINSLLVQNRQLVKEMQDSLDNVAHDLRTPMTRLRSVAEYGLQADDDCEKLREALSDCLEESERVLAMLKIMMSVAEAESGTMRLDLQRCEVGELLAEIVTLYEYVAEEKKVEVSLEAEEELHLIVDRTRISQVWANLLDNAVKYGRAGGWVKISAGVEGGFCLVVFEDNGMGISENEQGRIWERLYRGDRSRSEKGLGLGLNYVRAVVETHGGSVSVRSVLHEGSRFEVRLPLDQLSIQEKSQTSGE
ncbi:sensor histidine kinase [Desulfomarina sp.]